MPDSPIDLIATGLRRERDRVGLSLSELAKKAGVAKSTLSQLETGTGNPSIETLWSLATALGVPFSRLLSEPGPQIRVVKAGDGPATRSSQADYTTTLLAHCPPGAQRDIYRITIEPGRRHVSEAHMPGTVEHLVVGAGRLRIGVVGETIELGAGDYVSYPGDAEHSFEALAEDTTAVIVMENS